NRRAAAEEFVRGGRSNLLLRLVEPACKSRTRSPRARPTSRFLPVPRLAGGLVVPASAGAAAAPAEAGTTNHALTPPSALNPRPSLCGPDQVAGGCGDRCGSATE